jgi:hypothetical protein
MQVMLTSGRNRMMCPGVSCIRSCVPAATRLTDAKTGRSRVTGLPVVEGALQQCFM